MQGKRLKILLLLAVLVVYFSVFFYKAHFNISSDFVSFYTSSQAVLQHQPIYQPEPWSQYQENPHVKMTPPAHYFNHSANLNTPFMILLLAPLAFLSYGKSFFLWGVLSLIFTGLGARQLARHFSLQWLDVTLLLLISFPVYLSVSTGELCAFVFFAMTNFWCSARQDKPCKTGVLLGVLCHVKLFFGLFFLLFLLLKQWRVMTVAALTFLLLCLVSFAVFGADVFRQYYTVLHSVTWQGLTLNASIRGMAVRLWGNGVAPSLWDVPLLGVGAYYVCSALLLRGYARQVKTFHVRSFDACFALTLVVLLLLSPLGWRYYFALLSLPICVVLSVEQTTRARLLCLLAILFINIPLAWGHAHGSQSSIFYPITVFTLLTHYAWGLYALLILLYLLIGFLKEQKRPLIAPVRALTFQEITMAWLPGILFISMVLPNVLLQWKG